MTSTTSYKTLAQNAQNIANNMRNTTILLNNIAFALDKRACALMAMPDDDVLANKVRSTMNQLSSAYESAKPNNPDFDNFFSRIHKANSPSSAVSKLHKRLQDANDTEGMALLEDILSCPSHPYAIDISNDGVSLDVRLPNGNLIATYYGDPGYYDGIAIDWITSQSSRQCAYVELDREADELIARTWDGTSTDAVHHNNIDKTNPNGAYA